MASVIGLEAGWRVTYLGTSLPADEIVKSAQLVEASAVALSVVALSGVESAAAEVLEVRGGLPATVTVVAGGAGAESRRAELEEAGVMVLHGAAELGELLRHHAAAGSSR
jgi:MerR family transcriptional regulator, light-induced transcriptional regulator